MYDLALISYLHLPRSQWGDALTAAVRATAVGGAVLVVAHAVRNLTGGVGGPKDPTILLDPEDVIASAAELLVDIELAQLRARDVEGSDRPALDTVVLLRVRSSRSTARDEPTRPTGAPSTNQQVAAAPRERPDTHHHHEEPRHVPSSDLSHLRQDDLGRLRPARRQRDAGRGRRGPGAGHQAEPSTGFFARVSRRPAAGWGRPAVLACGQPRLIPQRV